MRPQNLQIDCGHASLLLVVEKEVHPDSILVLLLLVLFKSTLYSEEDVIIFKASLVAQWLRTFYPLPPSIPSHVL